MDTFIVTSAMCLEYSYVVLLLWDRIVDMNIWLAVYTPGEETALSVE